MPERSWTPAPVRHIGSGMMTPTSKLALTCIVVLASLAGCEKAADVKDFEKCLLDDGKVDIVDDQIWCCADDGKILSCTSLVILAKEGTKETRRRPRPTDPSTNYMPAQ